jgi:hypothetical protein
MVVKRCVRGIQAERQELQSDTGGNQPVVRHSLRTKELRQYRRDRLCVRKCQLVLSQNMNLKLMSHIDEL